MMGYDELAQTGFPLFVFLTIIILILSCELNYERNMIGQSICDEQYGEGTKFYSYYDGVVKCKDNSLGTEAYDGLRTKRITGDE